jgi:ADP-L-glycero-D-manno-heptose 6-epimerase
MQKVIVTGGAGFIGSNLAIALQESNYQVTVIDNFSSGRTENLDGFKGKVIQDSILNIDWDQFKDSAAIFHQAAITDTTVQDEELMISTNVEGLRRILETAASNNIRVIYASSAGVYGNTPSPQKEADAGRPVNLYGLSKWKADGLAVEYMTKSAAPIIGLRYFNVFGPRENYKGKMASIAWQTALRIASGQPPRLFKWGEQQRDQVYVKDVVKANLLALKSPAGGIVNVGSGRPVSFNQIIRELNRVAGTNYQPEYIDNPYSEAYQEYTKADLTESGKLLKYQPSWSFDDAITDYFSLISPF